MEKTLYKYSKSLGMQSKVLDNFESTLWEENEDLALIAFYFDEVKKTSETIDSLKERIKSKEKYLEELNTLVAEAKERNLKEFI